MEVDVLQSEKDSAPQDQISFDNSVFDINQEVDDEDVQVTHPTDPSQLSPDGVNQGVVLEPAAGPSPTQRHSPTSAPTTPANQRIHGSDDELGIRVWVWEEEEDISAFLDGKVIFNLIIIYYKMTNLPLNKRTK
ncbi:hypothetical protein HanIR_Chr13g0638571 [Helianthus annuus]|nr:hypothetical protein HanIR_Chr13g0638571 [Helianthus annuus]